MFATFFNALGTIYEDSAKRGTEAQMKMALAANELQRQQYETYRNNLMALAEGSIPPVGGEAGKFLMTDGECMRWESLPEPIRITKCTSCGSREFKEHHGQRVCIYCRSNA